MVCIGFASFALYSYLAAQNRCTQLKMRLPKIAKEIEALHQENAHLQYQISTFESPENLLRLATATEYSYLKFPFLQDVLTVKEGLALQWPESEEGIASRKPRSTVLLGAK